MIEIYYRILESNDICLLFFPATVGNESDDEIEEEESDGGNEEESDPEFNPETAGPSHPKKRKFTLAEMKKIVEYYDNPGGQKRKFSSVQHNFPAVRDRQQIRRFRLALEKG